MQDGDKPRPPSKEEKGDTEEGVQLEKSPGREEGKEGARTEDC